MTRFNWSRRRTAAAVLLCAILVAASVTFWQMNQNAQAAILYPQVSGLVGWWSFDEGSGTVAGDSSGNGNTGTIYGATWVSGRYGTALSFGGGSTDYVQVPDADSLDVTGDLTLSAWIYPTAANRMIIISKYWNNEFDLLITANGRIEIAFGDPYCDLFSVGSVGLNSWTQVCVVRKVATSEVDFYINGQLDSSHTYSATTISASNKPVQLGKDNDGANFYSGWVDEPQIYNRALSTNEVQANFQQSPGFSSNVLAKLPAGTTQIITTLSWQGTGSINVTLVSPAQNYTEATVPTYEKTTYSTIDGISSMLNIKRLSVSFDALPSDENWNVTLAFDNPVDYQLSVEVQK